MSTAHVNRKLTTLQILYRYFGLKPDQSQREFAQELAALGEKAKRELAELATGELVGMEPQDS